MLSETAVVFPLIDGLFKDSLEVKQGRIRGNGSIYEMLASTKLLQHQNSVAVFMEVQHEN